MPRSKRHSTRLKSLAISVCLLLLPHTASAALISTSVGVNNFTNITNPSGIVSVNGLNQFDSSLGTLTGVTLNVLNNPFTAELSLIPQSFDLFGGTFDSAGLNFQISLNISSGSGGFLFANEAFSPTISGELDGGTVGPTSYSASEDATTRLQNASLFNNFIGPGSINFLDLGIFTFAGSSEVFVNGGALPSPFECGFFSPNCVPGDANLDSFTVGPGTVRIDYTFTPAAVPLPASVWLFGSGLVGLIGLSRRKIVRKLLNEPA